MSAKQRYEAAVAAQDWETAEKVLRQGLEEAGEPRIATVLGAFLRKRGRLDEAEALLESYARHAPARDSLDLLGLIQYERQSFAACEDTLERLIALAPDMPISTYQMLAKVKGMRLGSAGRQEVMRRARDAHPGQFEYAAAYAETLSADEAIAELESLLPNAAAHPARAAYVLERLTCLRAIKLRAARALPQYGISWADTYQWSDPETLPALKSALLAEIEQGSRRADARQALASLALAAGEWDLAGNYLVEARNLGAASQARFAAFGREFHDHLDSMSDSDIFAGFAPVEPLLSPATRGDEVVYMASDEKYFSRFSLAFLRQLEAAGIPLDVHVHILDGDSNEWAGIRQTVSGLKTVRLTLTAEASGAATKSATYARLYYHAARYIRLYELLREETRPMWVIDSDVEMLRDPRPALRSIRGYDLAMKTNPWSFYPNLKILAGCFGAAPTPLGKAFVRKVAAYIVHWKNLGTWGWGVDQTALFSSYAAMAAQNAAPRALFLDDAAMNNQTGDTGTLRFLSGVTKYAGDKTRTA